MSKLPSISGKDCVKALEKVDFYEKRRESSHIILRRDEPFAQHDLVHRNGKTKEGKEIIIDDMMVDDIISKVESFISEIDQRLNEKDNLNA